MGFGDTVASAGPYANNLHLAPDRQPHQQLITQFLQARCSSSKHWSGVLIHVKSEESTTYGKVGDVERIYRCLIDMRAASDDTRYHSRVRRCHTPASTQAHTPAHSGSAHCPYSSRDTADQSRRRRRQSTGCSLQTRWTRVSALWNATLSAVLG